MSKVGGKGFVDDLHCPGTKIGTCKMHCVHETGLSLLLSVSMFARSGVSGLGVTPLQAPGMIRQNQTPDGASAGTPSPDNTPCACKNKTCQGGLSTVDSHGLAVLHPGFKRDRMASWRETSIFTDNGVNCFNSRHQASL